MTSPAQDFRPPLQEAADPKVNRRSLWQRTSGSILMAAICAILVFIVSSGADILMLHQHETARTTVELSDAISSLIIGLLCYRLIRLHYERREQLRNKVEVISDMNHHVRNALQVISLTSHGKDKDEITAIRESVNRIQWALRELLPKL
jgi:hypothetical protein